ncbi:MAG TPA: histidine phosphatase family protein [Jatrophihabitans sp.]|nr:histidine phosphatase family protein [Jatrophihabitans sp.]
MSLSELILVRHGESTGNVARERALADGAEMISIDRRDADVPLTELGCQQAIAFGAWLAARPTDRRPDAVWCSTYLRARHTAELALDRAGLPLPITLDERLRDRELGMLDLLTATGISRRFPEEARRRAWLGKLYYRPPGGESWADVALRLRSLLREVDQPAGPRRALLVCHDAVILLMRYICEQFDEQSLFATARDGAIGNATVTVLRRTDDGWQPELVNHDEHLSTRATEHPGERDDFGS